MRTRIDWPGWAELRRIGDLLICLAGRDLRVRYKQSVLGVFWAVIQPVSLMIVFVLVLGPNMGRSLSGGEPYALFVLAGLVPWGFFSASLTQSANCLVANRNLLTKVYFPREAFPFSCVAASLVDFAIGLAALAAITAYYHTRELWAFPLSPAFLFLPAVILVQALISAGLGMLLAMGHLFYRDVRPILTVALNLGMFVSAVVVPVPATSGVLGALFICNPLVHIITAYRDILLHGRPPASLEFAFSALVSLLIFAIGWISFRSTSHRFAESI